MNNTSPVKYFFLSDGWICDRVWEFGGLWDENTWRRRPKIQRLNVGIIEKGETLWLYQVEDAVLMVEVKPMNQAVEASRSIGQVILKRLIAADGVIERLREADAVVKD